MSINIEQGRISQTHVMSRARNQYHKLFRIFDKKNLKYDKI